VIESVGYNKWLILWDDDMERSIHASNILKFEADGDSIRRGTMPPASSVVGVGAFASIAQTAAPASTHLRTALPTMPPPASLVPTPAGPRPLPPSVGDPIENMNQEAGLEEEESPTTVTDATIMVENYRADDGDDDEEEELLIPTAEGGAKGK
jgi:hypothetical protein